MSDRSNESSVPDGWSVTELRQVIPGAEYGISSSLDGSSGIPVLRMNNLQDGSIDITDIKFSDCQKAAKLLLRRNDVLFNRTNSMDQVGRTSLWRDELPKASFASYLVRLLPDSSTLDAEFLVRWLNLPQIQIAIRRFATPGVHQVNINPTNLRRAAICFPTDVCEQRKICNVIAVADKLIGNANALIAKYLSIKQGLMHDLFTRGVDSHGHLRPTQADGLDLYKQSELGWIPNEWCVATIGDLFEKRTEHGREGLPVMSIVMRDGLVERSSVDRRVESNLPPHGHALVLKDDIAYNMMRMWQGVLGRATFDCLVSPAYVVLKPKTTINTRFAAFLFSDKRSIQKFRQFSQGVVDDRLRLYFHDLVHIPFSVPNSLDEQEEIANRIETCNKRIVTEKTALEQYQCLRLGLMQDLLTGNVRVKMDSVEEETDRHG